MKTAHLTSSVLRLYQRSGKGWLATPTFLALVFRRQCPHMTYLSHHVALTFRRQNLYFSMTPDTWAEKIESFELINSIRETNENVDSRNSCKRLGTSRLYECISQNFRLFHASNFSFRSFRIFLLMYPVVDNFLRNKHNGVNIMVCLFNRRGYC